MIELLYLAAFALAAYGTGNFLLRLLKIKFESFGEDAVLSQATGLVVFSYATLAAGLLGMLDSKAFTIVLLLLLLVFIRKIKKFAAGLAGELRQNLRFKLRLGWLLYFVIAALAVLNIFAALAPPHSSDAVAYHLAIPKIFAEHGRIVEIPYMVTSNYPLATEMLFLDGYLLKGGVLSEMIAAYIALLLTAAIFVFSNKHFGRKTALLASATFYTLPIVSVFNIRGFVDISTGLYAMAALIALFKWNEKRDTKLLALTGMLAGTAAATKMSAYPIPAVLFITVVCLSMKERLAKAAKNIVAYSAAAAAMMLPWMAKAYAYTGNPVYPLFYNVFGGKYLTEGLLTAWVKESLAFTGTGTGIIDLVKLSWNMTMHSPLFGELLGIGPVFLAFIPALFLMKKTDGKIKAMLAMAAALLVVWFHTAQSPRYIFFVYAILAIVSAYSISRLLSENGIGKIAGAAVAITIIINLALWAGANNDEVKAAAGLTDRESYLNQQMKNYQLLKYANENLEGAKICIYGSIRGYYSDNDYVWCNPPYQAYIDFYTIKTSGELLARMKEVGITHIIAEDSIHYWKRYYEKNNLPVSTAVMENAEKLMGEIMRNNAILLFENDEGKIYEVIYAKDAVLHK